VGIIIPINKKRKSIFRPLKASFEKAKAAREQIIMVPIRVTPVTTILLNRLRKIFTLPSTAA
jgi:hypothetical protein